jgi:tetratricopeptide (TPR) repeat protein
MKRAALIAAVMIAAAGLPAHAQPAGPGPGGPPPAASDNKEKARVHFQKAKELHEKKQYAEAAAEYLEAYRYMPAPAFIYNAGQVYRLGDQKEKAIEHYKKYLALEPNGEGAADARQFIAELGAALEAEKTAPGNGAGEPGGSSGLGEGAGGEAPPTRDSGERPGRSLMLAGMVSGGIGVAALGAAVVFALRARSAESDLDGYQGVWTPDREDRYASGESAERNMAVSVVVGVAALGAGGTMYFLGRRKAQRADAARTSIGAAAGGDAALLWVTGRF